MKKYLYFTGNHCSLCRKIAPLVTQALQSKKFFFQIYKLEDDSSIFNARKIRSLPTLIDEQTHEVFVGSQVEAKLKELLA